MAFRKKSSRGGGQTASRSVSPGPERTLYSYRAVRKQATESVSHPKERQSRQRLKRLVRNFELVVIVTTLIGVVGYNSLLDPTPEVTVRGASGGVPIRSVESYRSLAETAVARSWRNRNKLTLDVHGITDDIKKEAPEARNISVRASVLGKRPIITMEVKSAVLRIRKDSKDYVLTDDGQLVTGSSTAYTSLALVTDTSGLPFDAGQKYLTSDAVEHIQTLKGYIEASHDIQLGSIELPAIPNEFWVRLKDKQYYIKCTLDQDPRLAFGTLLASLNNFEQRHVIPAEYIDVRVEGKVFYK